MIKIIVLTPVRNEDWILEQFLSTTSLFADCIIVANQNSTDNSMTICRRFHKVQVVENNGEYNEESRQLLLIETARRLFPNYTRLLFCLDADELFSADSFKYQKTWEKLRTLKPGSSIFMEKPDLLQGLQRCVRWRNDFFPVGYVDDGKAHSSAVIHSKRIPENPFGEKIYIDDIKILHFAPVRRNAQSAKQRYYSVIENINNNNPVYLRRHTYKCFYSDANYSIESIEKLPPEWLKGWDEIGINLRNLNDVKYSWHDFEVLSYFKKYGCKKFFLEDIWDFDWETCRQSALEIGKDVPKIPIGKPGIIYAYVGGFLDTAYSLYKRIQFN
jgi:hypothetical protein